MNQAPERATGFEALSATRALTARTAKSLRRLRNREWMDGWAIANTERTPSRLCSSTSRGTRTAFHCREITQSESLAPVFRRWPFRYPSSLAYARRRPLFVHGIRALPLRRGAHQSSCTNAVDSLAPPCSCRVISGRCGLGLLLTSLHGLNESISHTALCTIPEGMGVR